MVYDSSIGFLTFAYCFNVYWFYNVILLSVSKSFKETCHESFDLTGY